MNPGDQHMDQSLAQIFEQAVSEGKQTDWNAFEKYRNGKKRRRLIYICLNGLMIMIIIAISVSKRQEIISDESTDNVSSVIPAQKKSGPAELPVMAGKEKPENHAANKTVSGKPDPYTETRKSRFKDEVRAVIRIENLIPEPEQAQISIHGENEITEAVNNALKPASWSAFEIKRQNETYSRIPAFELKTPLFPSMFDRFLRFQGGLMMDRPLFKVSSAGKDFIHREYENVRKKSESGMTGYGFRLEYGIRRSRFDIGIGIGYNQLLLMGRYNFMYSDKPVIDIDGKVSGYNSGNPVRVEFESKQKCTFVEFPMFIEYPVKNQNKTRLSVRLAYVPQFLRNIGGTLPNALFMDQKENQSTANYRLYSSSFEIGFRHGFKIQPHMFFEIMPLYRYNTGFTHSKSYYSTRFNDFGIQCSLILALKK